MTKKHVLLVGAGQLGSRHLQAMASCKTNIDVSVVDPSMDALWTAQERLQEVKLSSSIGKISFLQRISDVESDIDCCIIATNAQQRLTVLKELLEHHCVDNIIFEKVLFQSGGQIDEASAMLTKHGIKAWVNCGRRIQSIYRELQLLLQHEGAIDIEVVGNNWDMACNGIHLIDLWAYLSGDDTYSLNSEALSPDIQESKRAGYKEVSGTLSGFGRTSKFTLNCTKENSDLSLNILIKTPNYKIEIDEVNGKCNIENIVAKTTETIEISFLFQSQISNIFIDEILNSQGCILTPFAESALLHKPFLETLLTFINENGSEKFKVCPIT